MPNLIEDPKQIAGWIEEKQQSVRAGDRLEQAFGPLLRERRRQRQRLGIGQLQKRRAVGQVLQGESSLPRVSGSSTAATKSSA